VCLILIAILIGWSQTHSTEVRASKEAVRTQARELQVITVSYGEFVPMDELADRREGLVRRAFEQNRVGGYISTDGDELQKLSVGPDEIDRFLDEPGLVSTMSSAYADDANGDDYDGDGFLGTDDNPPLLHGEYIADIPRIQLDFMATIEPGIVITKTSTGNTEEFSKTYEKSSREEQYNASSGSEFKTNFKVGLSGIFGIFNNLPLFSWAEGSPKLDAGVEFNHSRKWNRSVTTQVQQDMERYFQEKKQEEISVESNAGFLRTQLLLTNVSHFAADMKITSLRAQAVAYNPRSGAKYAFGEVLIQGDIYLYSGTGNNTSSRFLEFSGINTAQMESALYEGYMFDFDISGDYQSQTPDGTVDWRARMSQALSKTAWFQVNYGDMTRQVIRQVAVQTPTGESLTVENGLTEIFGADNLDFAVHSTSGRRIITRIQHRQNRHAERNFNELSPAEQAEYGRWVVGYKYGSKNIATDLHLDSTPLLQGDVLGVYFLTKDDFIPPPAYPDQEVDFDLPTEGTIENGGLLAIEGPVKVGDVIEIDVESNFEIASQGYKHYNSVRSCGETMYNADCYWRIVEFSDGDFFQVPNLDWYRFKVSFGTTHPKTWLLPSQLGATVVSSSGFPEYAFTLRFTVTAAHLNNQPQGLLRVAVDDRADSLLCGCRGTNIRGRPTSCVQPCPDPAEVRSSIGQVRYYKYTPDVDIDGFTAMYHYGMDWDDFDFTVHPGAVELWDGKDNDQNGETESAYISGPSKLGGGQSALFRGKTQAWDGTSPTYKWYRREVPAGGSPTAWRYIGTGPSIRSRMPSGSDDPDLNVALDGGMILAAPLPSWGFDLKVKATVAGSEHTEVATKTVRYYKSPLPPIVKSPKILK
jgi:hypothetical protein